MRILLRVGGYAVPYRKMLTLGLVSMLGAGLLGILWPIMLQLAIDRGLRPIRDEATEAVVAFDGSVLTLVLFSLAIVGFAVGRANFREPLGSHLSGQLDEPDAIAQIAANYRACVDTWRAARG